MAKELQAKAAEMGKDFAASVEGKVIIGSLLGGALAAIIATNSKVADADSGAAARFHRAGIEGEDHVGRFGGQQAN